MSRVLEAEVRRRLFIASYSPSKWYMRSERAKRAFGKRKPIVSETITKDGSVTFEDVVIKFLQKKAAVSQWQKKARQVADSLNRRNRLRKLSKSILTHTKKLDQLQR